VTASGVPFVELIQPVIQVQPNPSRAVRLTMVAHSAQAKTRVSMLVSGGSMLGTTRISLIGTLHFGQFGWLMKSPRPRCISESSLAGWWHDYPHPILQSWCAFDYNGARTVARRSGG
jgi:hypothetical protein